LHVHVVYPRSAGGLYRIAAYRERSCRERRPLAGRKSILIAEEDPDERRLYRMTLVFEGYEVHEAGDGIEALTTFEQHPPDLVILDLDLPRLDGLSVQREIAAHAITRDIPIVLVTSAGLDTSALDVACVLRRPVKPDELARVVRSCLLSGAPGGVAS
jgi:CheY-like chemotaxis protein